MEVIDQAMVDWGMPMGPVALTDEVGLDVAVHVSHILGRAFGDRLPPPVGQDKLVASGRLGAKNGRGFYRYDGGRRGAPDPEIYPLLGIQPRREAAEPDGLVERMVLPMVNETARCLEGRVVFGPGDVDLAMILGTGFPPFRGGLCRWADSQGLNGVIEDLERLAGAVGPRFAPSAALRAAAQAGGFYARDWQGL
jgi:3-hydroxyacyl-CoA dehydrogenase/enoyl-CoA hydratase/3-hydroxybutyryl-CoA epimerase